MHHIISLSNRYTSHAKNVVSSNHMKVEVWHQEIIHICATRHLDVEFLTKIDARSLTQLFVFGINIREQSFSIRYMFVCQHQRRHFRI